MNIAGMLSIVVLARLLTPEDFGLVAIATTVLGIIVAVTELSLGSALIQRQDVSRDLVDSAWTLAFLRTMTIATGFALLSYPLAMLYDDMRLVPVFMVAGLTGALSGFINPHVLLSTKQLQFRALVTVQLTQKGVGIAIGIALALWFRSYWAIIIGNAVGAAVAALLSYIAVPYRPRFTLVRSRELLGFSSWLFLGQITNVLNWRFDQLVIGLILPKAQLGAYAVADNLSAIPTRETTAPITQALFPGFSRLNTDIPRLRRAYLTAQGALALIALPAGVGFALLAEPLVSLLLGPKWAMTVPLIQIISCCYAVQTLTTGLRPLAMSLGQTKVLFVRDTLGLAMRVIFVTAGLLGWGLTGMLWGRAISTVIGVWLAAELIRRVIGIGITQQLLAHWRTLAAIATMAVAVIAATPFVGWGGATYSAFVKVAVLGTLGGFVYIATLAALWQISGRSTGPETELVGIGRKLFSRGLAR